MIWLLRLCVRNVSAGNVVSAVAVFGIAKIVIIIIIIIIIYVTTVEEHGTVLRQYHSRHHHIQDDSHLLHQEQFRRTPLQTYHTICTAWFRTRTKLQYKYMCRRAARVGIWKGVIAAVTEPPPPPPRYVIVFLNPVTKFYFLWATVRLQIQTILILAGKIPNVTHFSCWLYGRACSQNSLTKLRRIWGIPYRETRLSRDSAWCR